MAGEKTCAGSFFDIIITYTRDLCHVSTLLYVAGESWLSVVLRHYEAIGGGVDDIVCWARDCRPFNGRQTSTTEAIPHPIYTEKC